MVTMDSGYTTGGGIGPQTLRHGMSGPAKAEAERGMRKNSNSQHGMSGPCLGGACKMVRINTRLSKKMTRLSQNMRVKPG